VPGVAEHFLVVPLGFVTGAFGLPVFLAWVSRRAGRPEFQGWRVALYLWAATGVFVGMTAVLLIWPWVSPLLGR